MTAGLAQAMREKLKPGAFRHSAMLAAGNERNFGPERGGNNAN